MTTKMLRAFCFALLVVFVSVNCKRLSKRMVDEDESATNDDTTRVKKVIMFFLLNIC